MPPITINNGSFGKFSAQKLDETGRVFILVENFKSMFVSETGGIEIRIHPRPPIDVTLTKEQVLKLRDWLNKVLEE